jgi:hypothetical protein
MQLFKAVNPQVLSEFKVALIYLEQWEILNPEGRYLIPVSGKIKSPEPHIRTKGSLGYLFDWFLRPNRNKNPVVKSSIAIQSGCTRRSPLQSFYRLEYSGEDVVDSISTDKFLSENPSDRRERDRWSEYVKGYLEARRRERAQHKSELPYLIRCPTDSEVASILLLAATLLI